MRTRNYIKAVTSSYLSTAIVTIVGFLLTPFVLKYLSREEYGIFLILADIVTWLTLLELGLSAVLNYKVAKLSAKPNQGYLNQMVTTVLYVQLGMGMLFVLAGCFLSNSFTTFFNVSESPENDITKVALIFIIAGAIKFVGKVFSALLVAHQQAHIDNMIKIFTVLFRAALTVGLLEYGLKLDALAYAVLITTIVVTLLTLYRSYRLLPELSLKYKYFSLSLLKEYFGLGIWFFVNGLAGIGIETLDRLISGKVLGTDMVTTLVLTGRVYLLTTVLVGVISNAARPMIGQMIGENKLSEVEIKIHTLSRISTGFAILFIASIFAGNAMFVNAWVGEENYGGWLLEAVIALSIIVKIWNLPHRVLTSSALYNVHSVALMRVVNMVLFMVLAYYAGMHYGLVGIVSALIVATLVTSFWYLPYLSATYFDKNPIYYFWTELKTLLPFFVMAFLLGAVFKIVFETYLSGFTGAGIAFSITFFITAFLWWNYFLDEAIRNQISMVLRKKIKG